MFKQFTEHLTGTQDYLLFSLGIFFVFFIVVSIVLIMLKSKYVEYMSELPLEDSTTNTPKSFEL